MSSIIRVADKRRLPVALLRFAGFGLVPLLTLSACTTSKYVGEVGFAEFQSAINKKGVRENALITFNSGEQRVVRGLRLAPDSSSFIEELPDGQEVVRLVATEDLREVRFRRRLRQFAGGFIAGAAVGSLLGLAAHNQSYVVVCETRLLLLEYCHREYVERGPEYIWGGGLVLAFTAGVLSMTNGWGQRFSFESRRKKNICRGRGPC